jgi:hypothetical protein
MRQSRELGQGGRSEVGTWQLVDEIHERDHHVRVGGLLLLPFCSDRIFRRVDAIIISAGDAISALLILRPDSRVMSGVKLRGPRHDLGPSTSVVHHVKDFNRT